MSELTLKRAIMLDTDEIIPAGTVLNNYGDFTPKSISPSLIASGKIKIFKGKRKKAFVGVGEENTIFFFRIPRECIDESTLPTAIKKLWIKGSDEISPFSCSVVAKKINEIRTIEECKHDISSLDRLRFFDKKTNPIEVILLSSIEEILIGSHSNLGYLKPVIDMASQFLGETCITYYYPYTSNIKVDLIRRKKFYVEQPSYKVEKYFDELDNELVNCYGRDGNHKFCHRLYVMEKGDNEWYKQFISSHSWLAERDYTLIENDSHIFCKYMYFDGQKYVSTLTVLHKSTNPYLFFKSPRKLMVLIKEHQSYY